MAGPFPGMDPYLEARYGWRGLHLRLVNGISADLQPQLVPRYIATVEVEIVMRAEEPDHVPDIHVRDAEPVRSGGVAVATRVSGAAATIPEIISVPEMTLPHRWIAIRDLKDREVVTVIEVLSHWNKREPGLRDYRRKQESLLLSDTSLVEIDLLRRGQHAVAVPESRLRPSPYRVCVHRAQANEFEVIRFGIQDPLPNVAIPLRAGEADVVLHLPAVFARCYEEGAYAYDVDYDAEPDPPLSGEDAQWAREQVRRWRQE